MLCSFLLGIGTSNVIPDKCRSPGSFNTAASATKLIPTQGLRCLPNSSFLKIAKETLFIDLTLREMETVERMALSQWSLLDTCMCALCSVLVITVDWIAARMPIQWARLARLWTRANFCSSSMAKVVWCSAHSCPELEQEKWFLVMTGFLEAVRRRHQQPKNLLDTRSEVSAKLKLSQNCEGDTLHWFDPLREWKLWREWSSHSGDCLTPACAPFLQYWWSIWTGLLHERHIIWQDWQDIWPNHNISPT